MAVFYSILGTIAVLLCFYLLFGYHVFSEFTDRNKRKKETLEQAGTGAHNEFVRNSDPEEHFLVNCDGQRLFGSLLRAKNPRGATVLLLHGYLGEGISHMGMFAPFYLEQGFDVFISDHRAHGKSEGTYIGFGKKDAEDCVLWCRYLLSQYPEGQKLLLHGVSMGGATVCTTAADADLPNAVLGAVSDCAYSSCEEQFTHILKFITPIPAKFILPAANIWCRRLAGYDLFKASPKDALKNAKIPFLFIHGTKDDFVPTNMVYALSDSCATEHETFLVKDAPHFLSFQTDENGYREKLLSFFEKIGI